MEIIQQFIEGKKEDPGLCEDGLVVTPDYIAVIDGVTSKSSFTYQGKTTGRLAMEITSSCIKGLDPNLTLEEILDQLNRAFQNFYQHVDFPLDKKQYGPQAAMALYSESQKEIYMIGDCQARINDQVLTNPKLSDEILSQMRALVMAVLRENPDFAKHFNFEGEPGREVILPWILGSTTFLNRDDTKYGYSLLNGETIPPSLIKTAAVLPGDHVTLTSDGYPEIRENFEETEAYLHYLLENDPECLDLFPSTKGLQEGAVSFDDRAYVEFII